MAIFNIWPKTLKAALVLLLTGLSLSPPATAQTYADDWWGYVIRNNLGTFTLGQDLDFSCLAGRGEVLVAVAIEADAAQTKIELRHGKHSYRANAKRRVDGAYIFAVPQHRTAALYQLLTEFPELNVETSIAAPFMVKTGAKAGSKAGQAMERFCSPERSTAQTATTTNATENLPCSQEGRARSEQSAGSLRLKLTNRTRLPRVVFWLDQSGQRRDATRLNPGQSITKRTQPDHVWLAADRNGTCKEMVLARASGKFVINR